jgi:hypothetical protein
MREPDCESGDARISAAKRDGYDLLVTECDGFELLAYLGDPGGENCIVLAKCTMGMFSDYFTI